MDSEDVFSRTSPGLNVLESHARPPASDHIDQLLSSQLDEGTAAFADEDHETERRVHTSCSIDGNPQSCDTRDAAIQTEVEAASVLSISPRDCGSQGPSLKGLPELPSSFLERSRPSSQRRSTVPGKVDPDSHETGMCSHGRDMAPNEVDWVSRTSQGTARTKISTMGNEIESMDEASASDVNDVPKDHAGVPVDIRGDENRPDGSISTGESRDTKLEFSRGQVIYPVDRGEEHTLREKGAQAREEQIPVKSEDDTLMSTALDEVGCATMKAKVDGVTRDLQNILREDAIQEDGGDIFA